MASVEESLHARLGGFAGLVSLVVDRVHPDKLPQGVAYPAVSYARIGTTETHCMGVDAGVKQARFQVSSWATTKLGAMGVAAQVDAALRRFRGTVSGLVIQDILFEDHQGFWDEDALVYHIPKDAIVIYQE